MARHTHDEDPHPKRTAKEWCDYGNAKLADPSLDCGNAWRAKRGLAPMRWIVSGRRPTPELIADPEIQPKHDRTAPWYDRD